MTEFLTNAELTQLTGYQQANSRANWLKRHGIPYQRNGRGLIVSRIHAREWLEGKQKIQFGGVKRTANTQGNREISVLSIIWTKARLWGMTERPWPAAGMKGWKNKEKAREFEVTDDLFDAVYEHADRILRGCMDIATATGMRITDAILVQRPRGGILRHQHHKTGKWVEFDITQSPVLTAIAQERERIPSTSGALLVTDKGEAITYAMLRKRWINAQQAAAQAHPEKAADIQHMYLRDMRKRAADLADGLDEAAQLLQHSSKSVTQKHYRTRATKLKAVR